MRTRMLAILICTVFMGVSLSFAVDPNFEPFYIYSEKGEMHNNFAPSGWMGDFKDLFYSEGWPNGSHSGATCIKVVYKAGASLGMGWVGMYWQDPPGNWGNMAKGGFDLTGAKKLSFWIRGEKGGEIINEIFVGGIKGEYADTCKVSIGPIDLTKEWQKFDITLEGMDLSHVIGGFGWATNLVNNPGGCTFYLDDIRYE
ncbi:MAG: hypothetical protein ABH885_02960 [Candidatus Omnitrophota bacterium]